MTATRTQDEVHPLLVVELRISLAPELASRLRDIKVGEVNTATAVASLYDSAI